MSNTPTEPSAQNKPQEDEPVINFDLSNTLTDIDKHLAAAKSRAAHERIETPAPAAFEIQTNFAPAPAEPVAAPAPMQTNTFGSGFLAELAQEAAKQQESNLDSTQAIKARSQQVHDALVSISEFFTSLIQFANNMEPDISRNYRLDARTAFSNLKWKDALLDSRKQDLSATALLAHLTFSVNYTAPEAVLVSRPWDQLEALKTELNSLKLKVLDEAELDGKRPKQEWLQVHLAPQLPVHLRFLANYDKGHIDILSRNLLSFGISSFRLQPEDVSSAMLDDLGRVLLSRADKLPAALMPL